MQLDIYEFLEKLRHQNVSVEMAANEIYSEIKRAESLKVGFMEEARANPEYFAEVSGQIDTYVYQLQELEKQLNPLILPIDQQAALNDELLREKIGQYINV